MDISQGFTTTRGGRETTGGSNHGILARCHRYVRRFLRTTEGLALMDFAFVAPVLVIMILGGVEAGRFMLLNQKLSGLATRTADLVSRGQQAITDDIDQIFAASEFVFAPFEFGADGVIIVTSISTDGAGTATVDWQMTGGGTFTATSRVGTTVGGAATMPTGYAMPAVQNMIVAEAFYVYRPSYANLLAPAAYFLDLSSATTATLYHTGMYRPRLKKLDVLVVSP